MEKIHYPVDNHLSFCRFIKDGITIGEYRIPDGSNHKERVNVANENNIDFDCYFIFYVEENNGIKHYNTFLNENGALGMYKNNNNLFLFDPKTNIEIKMIETFGNNEFF